MTTTPTAAVKGVLSYAQQAGYLVDDEGKGAWDYAIVSPDGMRYWTLTLKRNGSLNYAFVWEVGSTENRRVCSFMKVVDVERSVRRHAETLARS